MNDQYVGNGLLPVMSVVSTVYNYSIPLRESVRFQFPESKSISWDEALTVLYIQTTNQKKFKLIYSLCIQQGITSKWIELNCILWHRQITYVKP